MIKYYLLLCLGVLSGALFSQLPQTYVAGNQIVKIQPNTFFYTAGDFIMSEGSDEPSVLRNEGNIHINGNFQNVNTTDGSNFLNEWDSENSYGQVMINDGATAAGRLVMQKPIINPATFTWGQFAIPYQFSTVAEAFLTLFGIPYQAGGRYSHSIMT